MKLSTKALLVGVAGVLGYVAVTQGAGVLQKWWDSLNPLKQVGGTFTGGVRGLGDFSTALISATPVSGAVKDYWTQATLPQKNEFVGSLGNIGLATINPSPQNLVSAAQGAVSIGTSIASGFVSGGGGISKAKPISNGYTTSGTLLPLAVAKATGASTFPAGAGTLLPLAVGKAVSLSPAQKSTISFLKGGK